jgi:hypothetical protein
VRELTNNVSNYEESNLVLKKEGGAFTEAEKKDLARALSKGVRIDPISTGVAQKLLRRLPRHLMKKLRKWAASL